MASGRDVDQERAATTTAALRVLAELAPDRREPPLDASLGGQSPIAWVGSLNSVFREGEGSLLTLGAGVLPVMPPAFVSVWSTPELRELQRRTAVAPGVARLQLGWMWARGEVRRGDRTVPLLLPLLSRSVRFDTRVAPALVPTSPWSIWPLVSDARVGARLEAEAQFGGGSLDDSSPPALLARLYNLRNWVLEVLDASGLPPVDAIGPPNAGLPGPGAVTAGFAVYAERPADPGHPQETLRTWATTAGAASTALASLYAGAPTASESGSAPTEPPAVDAAGTSDEARRSTRSPLALNDRQADVVLAARRAPITVVSGPPGTGKSQTAVAVALDTIAQGQSVLVATQSATAADVLADLLDRVPGPTPVLFGGGERATALAAKLADGAEPPVDGEAEARRRSAEAAAAEIDAAVRIGLDAAAAHDAWSAAAPTVAVHAAVAPRLFDGTAADHRAIEELLDRARPSERDGWWARRRRRSADRELRAAVGAGPGPDLDAIARAVEVAGWRASAQTPSPLDGDGERRWDALVSTHEARRDARARALAAEVARRTASGHRAVAALATALRSGRATRRAHLATIDVRSLTSALPLWVGTLTDIESMLPAVAGAFDVVILDEASQIDQVSASAALLRAERAVVIGDPRQLRFVSFVADDTVRAAVESNGAQALRDRLDVRRVSAFDLAASASPVVFLDEHYRSGPHLIGFSARRFYDDRLHVATRHPRNESADLIDVRRVSGERVDGVNRAEVEAALEELEVALARPGTTVGLISPYRPQVDALRTAVGDRISLEVLESRRVRIGTVHQFQGTECDVVIASFAVSDRSGRDRSFLEDPNLFNVLVTRARQRLLVLASLDDPPPGLLHDYLRWGSTPPGPPTPLPIDHEWTGRVADALRDCQTTVRAGYPVGRHVLDLVVGDGDRAMAVSTRVHPEGASAHIRRHLALARAGWNQTEAFAVAFDDDPVAAAFGLRDRVAPVPR